MVEDVYRVIWDRQALNQMAEIYDYILQDSIQNAQIVRQKILNQTARLAKNPWRYNSDKLRLDKDSRFRAFELYKFRITFFVNEDSKTVIVLRVRSTWRDPLTY